MAVLGSKHSRARTDLTPPPRRNGNEGAKVRSRGVSTTTKAGAALVDPDKTLTDKQKLFVKLWAQGESPLSASIKAGYSDGGTFAYRMIYMPNVLKLYNEEKAAFEAANQMTRKRVVDGLLDGIEMAKMMAEPSSVIQGWKTIGQMCGYFAPVEIKHNHTVEGKLIVERLDKLSDDELLDLINRQAQAISEEAPNADRLLPADEPDAGDQAS